MIKCVQIPGKMCDNWATREIKRAVHKPPFHFPSQARFKCVCCVSSKLLCRGASSKPFKYRSHREYGWGFCMETTAQTYTFPSTAVHVQYIVIMYASHKSKLTCSVINACISQLSIRSLLEWFMHSVQPAPRIGFVKNIKWHWKGCILSLNIILCGLAI